MSWDFGILDTVSDAANDMVSAYAEREVERVKPEPANTANEPKQNPSATAIKYDDVAATQAVEKQAANATAAKPKTGFLSRYGKWLAVGGGTVVVLGVIVIAAKGGK